MSSVVRIEYRWNIESRKPITLAEVSARERADPANRLTIGSRPF